MFKDVDVISKLNFNTDHRMVRGVIQLINNKSRKHIISSTKNMLLPSPIPQKIFNDFELSINEIDKHKTLQEKYDLLENKLRNLNYKLSTNKEKKNKLGYETLKLMKERNTMLQKRKENH